MFSEKNGKLSIPLTSDKWAVLSVDGGMYTLVTPNITLETPDFMEIVLSLVDHLEINVDNFTSEDGRTPSSSKDEGTN